MPTHTPHSASPFFVIERIGAGHIENNGAADGDMQANSHLYKGVAHATEKKRKTSASAPATASGGGGERRRRDRRWAAAAGRRRRATAAAGARDNGAVKF